MEKQKASGVDGTPCSRGVGKQGLTCYCLRRRYGQSGKRRGDRCVTTDKGVFLAEYLPTNHWSSTLAFYARVWKFVEGIGIDVCQDQLHRGSGTLGPRVV